MSSGLSTPGPNASRTRRPAFSRSRTAMCMSARDGGSGRGASGVCVVRREKKGDLAAGAAAGKDQHSSTGSGAGVIASGVSMGVLDAVVAPLAPDSRAARAAAIFWASLDSGFAGDAAGNAAGSALGVGAAAAGGAADADAACSRRFCARRASLDRGLGESVPGVGAGVGAGELSELAAAPTLALRASERRCRAVSVDVTAGSGAAAPAAADVVAFAAALVLVLRLRGRGSCSGVGMRCAGGDPLPVRSARYRYLGPSD
jgi:hypothetical protein